MRTYMRTSQIWDHKREKLMVWSDLAPPARNSSRGKHKTRAYIPGRKSSQEVKLGNEHSVRDKEGFMVLSENCLTLPWLWGWTPPSWRRMAGHGWALIRGLHQRTGQAGLLLGRGELGTPHSELSVTEGEHWSPSSPRPMTHTRVLHLILSVTAWGRQ